MRLRGYILTRFSYKWVWSYRNRWDAAALELCIKHFSICKNMSCKEEASCKWIWESGTSQPDQHILFSTFDFAPVFEAITISSLIELRVGKTLLSLFLIVYWCQSNFRWSSSFSSFPFCMARWFGKTQRFFHTRHWFSCLRTKVAKQKWPNRNIIHTAILLCDSKFHHHKVLSHQLW